MERLRPFVGRWVLSADFPRAGNAKGIAGHATFEWDLDGRFLLQRTTLELPEAPDTLAVIAPDAAGGDGFTQHYFDSRGVVRLYEMTFDGRIWTLARDKPDFSPLNFAQRFTGELSPSGDRIDGHWDITNDAGEYMLDIELTYTRA